MRKLACGVRNRRYDSGTKQTGFAGHPKARAEVKIEKREREWQYKLLILATDFHNVSTKSCENRRVDGTEVLDAHSVITIAL
jgi:hypothetical protein